MKKIFYFLFLIFSLSSYAQKVTEQQAENSTDAKVIANFIKNNPDHPRTPEFKRKLFSIINTSKTPAQQEKIAKPVVNRLGSDLKTGSKSTGSSKSSASSHNQKTADLLTHMFSNDPNRKDAYVQITNKSKCNLIVKISGKKFYNLTVPANNQNFLLIDKGTYTFSSSICDAKYSETKNIKDDIAITLNAPVMRK